MNRPTSSFLSIAIFLLLSKYCFAQTNSHELIGYLHNWQDTNAPYIPLDQVDSRYSVINIAFATPQSGTDYIMEFTPDQVSVSTFISQIQAVQAQQRKVLISIGGATAPISLDNIIERDSFINSMTSILNLYNFDGIDIDLEGSSLLVSGGTIANPIDQPVVNLIYAVKQIMANYHNSHGKRLLLTMAPETAFVQGGQSAYAGIWGAYLPVIHALRDSLYILYVQLYNSGSMYGIDGNIYTQGTSDFIIAMCEAVMQGFNTAGGMFAGLPANKVAVGLPACTMAAGGGYADTASVRAAVNYLCGKGPKPGAYTLVQSSGYPSLKGLMTWSINWDAVANCGGAYEYAQSYDHIFNSSITDVTSHFQNQIHYNSYPNPASDFIQVSLLNQVQLPINMEMTNVLGQKVYTQNITSTFEKIDVSTLPKGIYFLSLGNLSKQTIVKE